MGAECENRPQGHPQGQSLPRGSPQEQEHPQEFEERVSTG